MLTPVRNGPLGKTIVQDATTVVVGTVSPGNTWLLKTVHLLNASISPATVTVGLAAAADGVQARVTIEEIEPAGYATWEGWTTLGPGDKVYVSTNVGGIHVWLSGADLPGAISQDAV